MVPLKENSNKMFWIRPNAELTQQLCLNSYLSTAAIFTFFKVLFYVFGVVSFILTSVSKTFVSLLKNFLDVYLKL